jgi:hypothetical protein
VFENRVLMRIPPPRQVEITRGWRKSQNEELHNLYHSLTVFRMIKSRRMRFEEYVVRMGERRNAFRILVGNV